VAVLAFETCNAAAAVGVDELLGVLVAASAPDVRRKGASRESADLKRVRREAPERIATVDPGRFFRPWVRNGETGGDPLAIGTVAGIDEGNEEGLGRCLRHRRGNVCAVAAWVGRALVRPAAKIAPVCWPHARAGVRVDVPASKEIGGCVLVAVAVTVAWIFALVRGSSLFAV
jgi:hypothetical protein